MSIESRPSLDSSLYKIANAADTMFQIHRGLRVGELPELTEAWLRASHILKLAGPGVIRNLCRDAGVYAGIGPEYWASTENLVAANVLLSRALRTVSPQEAVLAINLGVPESTIKDLAHSLEDKFKGLTFKERYLLLSHAAVKLTDLNSR